MDESELSIPELVGCLEIAKAELLKSLFAADDDD